MALGGGGFTATLQRNPSVNAEAVLLRLLELPAALFEREGTASLVVFDEIQDVLAVPGADGKIRSVIQHQAPAATYGFAGSAPGVMQQLFADPKRPLLDSARLAARWPMRGTWVSTLDQAAADTAPLMRAIWRALTVNERRVARALAVLSTPLHGEETAAAVGIKRSSIGAALESLAANADVITGAGRPRLTDPMLELWLQDRGLTPAAGADDPEDGR